MKSSDAISSNKLQWLDASTGHLGSSPNNGHQDDMPNYPLELLATQAPHFLPAHSKISAFIYTFRTTLYTIVNPKHVNKDVKYQ